MKLSTIWTMPACSFHEKIVRTGDWLAQQAAAAIPSRVRYWAFVQGSAAAIDAMPPTTVVTDVRLLDALRVVPGSPR